MEEKKEWLDAGWKHDPEMLKYIRKQMVDRGYPGIDMEDIDEVLDIATDFAPQEVSVYQKELASLKEVVKGMIPIVESFQYKGYNPYTTLLDRAKTLL